ncbi:MAG: phosphoadenosine phosphosulfate reductase family protein, partial [Thaumarchaeota archaeon]|nr:phosphoadenosine phosphosulfate reductase family protein [Nitrososphaerota archaeon]
MFVILELSLIDISNDYKTNQKMIFMSKFTTEQISELNDKLKTPEEVLQWGLENIHPKLALASSFGAEDVCVIHMLSKINPEARVFSLDTGRLNQETYDVMDEIRKKYNTKIE